MVSALKTIKGAMKAVVKAKASPKASPKAPAVPKKAANTAKLTQEAVDEHTRAHEKLLGKGLKTADEVLAELGKMPKKDQEQIWKQFLVCIQCNSFVSFIIFFRLESLFCILGWTAFSVF